MKRNLGFIAAGLLIFRLGVKSGEKKQELKILSEASMALSGAEMIKEMFMWMADHIDDDNMTFEEFQKEVTERRVFIEQVMDYES